MKDNNFTSGSILKKLVKFMFPILGSLVLQAMYGAVDLLVVGRFGTTAGLSGVSTGSQVLNLVTFVMTGLSMGVTVEIGHAIGEERRDRIGPVIGGSVLVFGLISIVLCVIMVPFARTIAVLMQAPQEAVDLTAQYIRICGAGIFFIIAYNLISAIFRGLGDSHTPLLFVLIACIINVIGDLVLVAGFHMNVAGAAIATAAAQAVSVVLSLIIMKKSLPYEVSRKDIRFNHEIKAAMQVGMPLGLQELLTQISFMALCAFVNRLGLEASSGYGIASKIVSFVMLVPSSLNQSMSSFVDGIEIVQSPCRRVRDHYVDAVVPAYQLPELPRALFHFLFGECVPALAVFRVVKLLHHDIRHPADLCGQTAACLLSKRSAQCQPD